MRLNLEFLYFSNATDLQLLQNMKEAFDARVSICHSALVMANAFMHAGTTRDTFLRENLEWLKTATNWAMFGATASLGVIHHGHLGKVCFSPALILRMLAPACLHQRVQNGGKASSVFIVSTATAIPGINPVLLHTSIRSSSWHELHNSGTVRTARVTIMSISVRRVSVACRQGRYWHRICRPLRAGNRPVHTVKGAHCMRWA